MARLAVFFVTLCVFQAAWGSALGVNNVGVYGGDKIDIREAPYMALLEFAKGSGPSCGGVIIDRRFILTTSTCCELKKPVRARIATDGTEGTGGYINIANVYKYPKSGLKANICLVQLAREVPINNAVKTIPLDDGSATLIENVKTRFTAFGSDVPNVASESLVLRRAELPIDGSDWCKRDSQRLDHSIFCAGNKDTNACIGDAGGALTLDGVLVGVLSDVTSNCQSRAARFTRISYHPYRSWILNTIKNNP